MAHYAFLDENNVVVTTIVGIDEDDTTKLPDEYENWEAFYSAQKGGLTCIRTSYNTRHNEHLLGGTPFRGNYASPGSTYDAENDIFVPTKPAQLDSWVFNVSNAKWEAPIECPGDIKDYAWEEDNQQWIHMPQNIPEDITD
tara:strand:+ start:296 stop:718 length:423 start_codon:yes stop_codon:yes gene_type:complete